MSVKQENRWKKYLHEKNKEIERKEHDALALAIIRPAREPLATAKSTTATKAQVRSWMRRAVDDDEYDDCTSLAEGANAALELPPEAMDDPDHWVWEEAARLVPA